jgi:hypothetical protein
MDERTNFLQQGEFIERLFQHLEAVVGVLAGLKSTIDGHYGAIKTIDLIYRRQT